MSFLHRRETKIMAQNFKTFRGMLRAAICNRTQAQFANESGISAEHLNRMLNSETINRPTKTTLTKIASAAKNGITVQKLTDALDSEDEKKQETTAESLKKEQAIRKAQRDFAPTFEEQAHQSIKDLNTLITERVNYPFIIHSASELMENLMNSYADEYPDDLPISYDMEEPRPYFGHRHTDVQYYISVFLSMANYETSAETTMLIHYTEISDQLAIQNVTMKVADIEDLYGMPPAAMDELKDGDDGIEQLDAAYEKPYYIEFTSNCHFKEIYQSDGKSAEERLLDNIFGKKYEYPTSIFGTGFKITDVPENFGRFIADHKRNVIAAYDDEPDVYELLEEQLDALLNETQDAKRVADFLDKFDDHGYFDFVSCQYGWLSAVANVMRIETGWTFESFPHVTSEKWPERSDFDCIMIRKENSGKENIKREALLNAICQYARELNIELFGDILFHTVIEDFDKPHTYRVQPLPEPNDVPDENVREYQKLTPENRPEKTGPYHVKLKDGRTMRCFYLKEQNVWIRFHKEWSHMIDSFDPTPANIDE